MKKADEMKWVVHPHSYADHTEISVIHESEFHAMESCGWFSDKKIFIYTDSMYGVAPADVKIMLRKYAEDLCSKMNSENKVSIEECQSAINYRNQLISDQMQFCRALAKTIPAADFIDAVNAARVEEKPYISPFDRMPSKIEIQGMKEIFKREYCSGGEHEESV